MFAINLRTCNDFLIATVSLPSRSSLLKVPNKRVKRSSVQFRNAQYVWCILMLACVAG